MFGINPSNDTYIGPIDPYAGGAVFYGVSANVASQTLYTGATARLHITSGGNVGIGTTSPSSKLEVYTATGDTKLTIATTGGNSYVPRLSLDKRGDSAWNISSPAGGFNFAIDQDGTTRLWIASGTGNVGIGTTSPTQKLDVAGAISVSGSVIDYEVAPALIAPGPAVNIISFVPGTTKAAFVDYVIVDSSGATNQRVGTIMVSISLNTVSAVINEVTTIDIGNTSAITFAVAYGAPTWLTATNSGITPYDINYMVRYF
jgi:hypothetical protein